MKPWGPLRFLAAKELAGEWWPVALTLLYADAAYIGRWHGAQVFDLANP